MKSTPDSSLQLNPSPEVLQGKPSNVQSDELAISGADLVNLMRLVLPKGKPFRFHARGGSMAPFIQDGDAISILPLRASGPGLGEIVAFLHPQTGQLVVHRVIGRHGLAYLIQGDNMSGGPDLVPLENLLGRVAQLERKGHQVRLGLGPERFLIALSARSGLLVAVLRRAGSVLRKLGRNGKR